MKAGKTVLAKCTKWLCLILFFLLASPGYSQVQSEDLSEENLSKQYFTGFDYFGVSVGVGPSYLKSDVFNERLKSLQLLELNNTLTAANICLSLMNKAKDEISLDYLMTGTANFNETTHVLINTSTFGLTFYKSLLPRNYRFGLHFMSGLRETNMNFEYNNSRNASNTFNSLFSNRGHDSRQITLNSHNNIGFTVGGRLMLPLTGKESIKPWKFSLALESGYSYYFITTPWKEIGSFRAVADMPELKPDNLLVSVTISGRRKL